MKGLGIYQLVLLGAVILWDLFQLSVGDLPFTVFVVSVGLYVPMIILAWKAIKLNDSKVVNSTQIETVGAVAKKDYKETV